MPIFYPLSAFRLVRGDLTTELSNLGPSFIPSLGFSVRIYGTTSTYHLSYTERNRRGGIYRWWFSSERSNDSYFRVYVINDGG